MQLHEGILFANRYELKHLLGRGGFSEVWLSDDVMTSLEVALKVYAPGTGMDEMGVKLFSSEFSLVFNLNHTNLLKPTYYDTFENMPYLVLPYCPLGSVAGMVGNISEEEAWKFLCDITAGLEYLHNQDPPVIHQDIKPDNILKDISGQYLLTDFGISIKARNTLRKSLLKVNTSVGTLAYMGPERFSKHPLPIKASDIFSLGVTLYELLTGTVPFGEHGGLLLQHGAEIPELEGVWSSELRSIIMLCLQKDTWERPTASEVREYAQSVLKGEKPKLPVRAGQMLETDSLQNKIEVSQSALPSFVESIPIAQKKDSLQIEEGTEKVLGTAEEVSTPIEGKKIIKENPEPEHSHKWLKLGSVIGGIIMILGVAIAILPSKVNENKDKYLDTLNVEIDSYHKWIQQGDSLFSLGETSSGDDYELFYKDALAQYDTARIIANKYKETLPELQNVDKKRLVLLQKMNRIYAEFVSLADTAEIEKDYALAEIFFRRAARLIQDSTLLSDFHIRQELQSEESEIY